MSHTYLTIGINGLSQWVMLYLSHRFCIAIKPVTKTACAIRELDVADCLPERSLLHWYFSRSASSTSCCDWFLDFFWRLHSGLNENIVLRGQRPASLLELFESLSTCHLTKAIELVTDTMADGVELKTLGQFSNRRGKITAQPPPPFRDARYAGQRILSSEEEANAWIRFGMPPVIVHSAYFANSRISSEATAASLEMAYKILRASQNSEKECSGWEGVTL